jgi:beta-galactosidase/beta-glucuronidase
MLPMGRCNEATDLIAGMTLRASSDLVSLAGVPRLDWPPAVMDNGPVAKATIAMSKVLAAIAPGWVNSRTYRR